MLWSWVGTRCVFRFVIWRPERPLARPASSADVLIEFKFKIVFVQNYPNATSERARRCEATTMGSRFTLLGVFRHNSGRTTSLTRMTSKCRRVLYAMLNNERDGLSQCPTSSHVPRAACHGSWRTDYCHLINERLVLKEEKISYISTN